MSTLAPLLVPPAELGLAPPRPVGAAGSESEMRCRVLIKSLSCSAASLIASAGTNASWSARSFESILKHDGRKEGQERILRCPLAKM